MILLRKSDLKAKSQLTSQPVVFELASAGTVICPTGEVRESSCERQAPQGHWRDQGIIAQRKVCQGIYTEMLLRRDLLACAWVLAVLW